MWWKLLLAALFLSGCAQTAPAPQSAATIAPVPGMSVIYIVRTPMDSKEQSGLSLDDRAQITTHWGTHYRWEVPPGTHRVAGIGRANESVTLTTAPGSVYFLEHTVRGTARTGPTVTALRQIDEQRGRELVQRSQMM